MSTVDPRRDDLPREERVDALIDGIEIVRARVEHFADRLDRVESAREREREAEQRSLDKVEETLNRMTGDLDSGSDTENGSDENEILDAMREHVESRRGGDTE